MLKVQQCERIAGKEEEGRGLQKDGYGHCSHNMQSGRGGDGKKYCTGPVQQRGESFGH